VVEEKGGACFFILLHFEAIIKKRALFFYSIVPKCNNIKKTSMLKFMCPNSCIFYEKLVFFAKQYNLIRPKKAYIDGRVA